VQRAFATLPGDARACWRDAALAAHWTRAADVVISCEIDEGGRFRDVRASGGPKGLGSCVAAKIALLRSRAVPDTGTVRVETTLEFRP